MRALAASFALTALSLAAPAQAQRVRLAGSNEAYVLIEGPRTAMLERQSGDSFVAVCAAPCDRPFPLGVSYRIAGEDVHPSEPFVLRGDAGSTVTLRVDDTKHHTGAVVVQGGVLITLVGGLTLVGGIFGTCSETDNGSCDRYRWLPYVGGAIAAVGVATLITGIVLMSKGSHSMVEQTNGSPLAPPAAKPVAFVLPPAVLRAAPFAPAGAATPILTFSF